jgi:hypothetical protein
MHLFNQMPSSFTLLKKGALLSRLGFEVKNRCQVIHNCKHFDGPAESQTQLCRSRPRVACLEIDRLGSLASETG